MQIVFEAATKKSTVLKVKFNLTLNGINVSRSQLRSTCFREYVRLDFSVLEGSTLGRHDRVIATRDCGSVLTQLAKWPLQIESRPRATDIEEKEREREEKRS